MEINERIAVLEARLSELNNVVMRRDVELRDIIDELKGTRRALTSVEEELLRYKGFFGGIAFMFSCVGVFLYKFAGPILEYIRIKT